MELIDGGWPPLTYEDVDWVIDPRVERQLDIWQKRRMGRPYAAAIVPEIADLSPQRYVSQETLELVERTSLLMARFDAESAALPVPMPAVLLRSEAASSSQIENLTASSRNIAIAELGVSGRENAQVIAANSRAMRRALAVTGDIDLRVITSIHDALLRGSAPDIAGRLRDRAVWVGSSGLSPHGADYVAPQASRVSDALADLCLFARRTDVPGLVRAAVVHAQFETIHPFEDGNGRTGRALLHVTLRAAGLVNRSTVPVSAGLLGDVRRYFEALSAYRAGDPDPIVVQVANGAEAAVVNGRLLAERVVEIREEWLGRIRARSDSTAWRLADHLFAQPVVNASHVAQFLDVSDRAARNAIDVLETAEVMTVTTAARRNQLWQAPQVLAAMDAFAARATRRSAE